MTSEGGGVLSVGSRVPITWLPTRYRAAMMGYLEQGILPAEGDAMRQLLEGQHVGIYHSTPVDELYDLAALAAWLDAHLPPQCWGNRDQVQLWIVYVRRARGRALLAEMAVLG